MEQENKDTSYYFTLAVILLLIIRLFVSWFLPLTDTTEARYGEIARLMYETKDWVVLHVDYGFPFWAKPPLSTWLSAASISLFGINEFALRLPSFLLSLLIVIFVGKFAFSFDRRRFWIFSFVVFSTPEFIIHAGVLSTDTAFNLSIVLAMISFWKAMNQPKTIIWGYLFFVGIGLGCLAKGPLVFVLVLPPLFVWCLIQKKWNQLWQRLPWILGSCLFLLIALPWYLLAENQSLRLGDFCVNIPKELSPSTRFLDYFIVGEHIHRFLQPGWAGDLYGSGHFRPFATIWLFLVLFIPRSLYLFYKILHEKKSLFKDSWVGFLLLWFLWTPIFFTFSRNILHTYTLPCAIPCALLIMYWLENMTPSKKIARISLLFATSLLIIVGIFFDVLPRIEGDINSDKLLIVKNITDTKEHRETPVFYWKDRTYSGQFYTRGRAKTIHNFSDFSEYEKLNQPFYFIVRKKDESDFKAYSNTFKLLDSNRNHFLYLVK